MLEIARKLARHRGLLATLTVRELKGRYRGSFLGFFWSLAQPLLLLIVYSLVFGHVFQPRVAGADPYSLFLVCGLFPWIWFSTALGEATVSLTDNSGLIRRSVFPIELLPAVPVLANLVQFVLALPVLGIAILWGRFSGWPVGGWGVLSVPLIVLVELPLVAGLSLGLAALHAHFKDVRDLLTSVLTLLFFLSPIIYPIESVTMPALRLVVKLSPATSFTLAYQQAMFEGHFPATSLWIQMGLVSLIGWSLGALLFSRLRETVVEAV